MDITHSVAGGAYAEVDSMDSIPDDVFPELAPLAAGETRREIRKRFVRSRRLLKASPFEW